MKKGFSLIEILVVFAILGTVAGIGLSVLSASLKSSAKTAATNKVKQNGDSVIETMTRTIRSAPYVSASGTALSVCTDSSCTSTTTTFRCVPYVANSATNGVIQKQDSPTAPTIALTADGGSTPTKGVNVTSCDFHIASNPNAKPQIVYIGFTLTNGAGLTSQEDVVTIPFQTQVSLRTYGQ